MTYEEWKKKREESTSSGQSNDDDYNRWLVQSGKVDIESVGKDISDRVNVWLKNNESFIENYNTRYSGNNDTYRADSTDWLSNVTKQKSNFDTEAESIMALLNRYKSFFNEDYVKSVTEALDSNRKVQGDVVSASAKDSEYWSKWKSEDAYKEALAGQKEYEGRLSFDLEAGQREIDDLATQLSEINDSIGSLNQKITAASRSHDTKTVETLREKRKKLEETKNSLESTLSQKKQYHTLAGRAQKAVELSSVADKTSDNYDPDFDKYASKGEALGTDPKEWWKNAENAIAHMRNDPQAIESYESSAESANGASWGLVENTLLDDITYKAAKYMTPDQFSLYNYYLAKDKEDGTNLSDEYLSAIEETLNELQGAERFKAIEGKTFQEYVFAIEAGLDQFSTGIKSLLSNEDYIPTSGIQYASSMVREDLADNGAKLPEWLGGSSLGQVGYDIINTTSNMLPSILASTAVNVVAPGSGAVVGATLMGASAGGSAKAEMLRLGYSKEQANTYGIMVGIAEGGMEYLLGGISKLGGKLPEGVIAKILTKVDNAFARTAIKIGGSMLSEGLEEGLQTIIEPWLKEIATNVDWEDPNIDEVLYSSLLGALSAFVLEGGTTVAREVGTYKSGKTIQKVKGGVEKLQSLGSTFSADTVAYKIASKVNENTDAYTIGRLLNEVGATLSEQNVSDIIEGLTSKGIRKADATKIARGYQAYLNSEMNLSDEAVKTLEGLSPLADVLRTNIIGSNTTVYQRTRGYSDLMALANEVANPKKKAKSERTPKESTEPSMNVFDQQMLVSDVQNIADDISKGTNSPIRSSMENKMAQTHDAATRNLVNTLGVKGVYSSSETGSTRLKSNRQRVEIVGVASLDKEGLKLKLKDGSVVDAKDINFSTSEEALVYEAVANMGMSANTAWEIIKGFDPKSNQKGAVYAMGALEAYTYGHNGVKVEGMSKNGFASLLSATQKNTANTIGGIDAKAKVDAKQSKIDTEYNKVRNDAKSKGKPIPKRSGQVVFEGERSKLTSLQESQFGVLEKVAEGLGVTFHIFESTVDANGKRYYKMPNGKYTSANGWYDTKTGEIWIDLYAGNDGQGTMIFTAAHELTHFIKQWSPAKFKIFADFLFEQYGKKGQDVNELIRNQMQKAKANGRTISWDEAYEEVVADSTETFLRDSKAAEKIAALREKDTGLANKIKSFLGQMLAKMRNLMEELGLAPETNEGKMVAEITDSLQKLYDLWTDALADAGRKYSTLAEIDFDTESVAPMLSERTWTASEYVTEREETAKQISKALGVDIKTAYKYIDDINGIARLIADDRARLDYEPNLDENATVLKPNSEYKYSVDMSTLCAKRLLFTGTFNAIQRALPNTVFDSEDIVALREMMLKRGYEVACGICYVESTRREIGRITQEFIDRYKIAQKTGMPISRINSSGKEVVLKSAGRTFSADKNYTPNLGELNTTDIDIVKRDHREVYDAYLAFMNARGQAKPKLLETRAEYKGEILKHFKAKSAVEARNNAGGLRLQSFSDFEVPHMIDMMQIVMDMARVGLKSQAYTKVPAFAEVFGDSGVKINLSLIAKGDGLDSKGNLIFDDVEGINHTEAFKLRDKYSKNVGTILVGKTDAHIIAAMADPRIDYIIPFHKSSWKESLYDALGLTGYADYTDYQNEKAIDKDRKIKNFDPSEYWDFTKSGDENAQIYLEKCREDGRIPKFPQFQGYPGYWKLLIDFKMYDNNGVGSPQEVVRPTFNTEASERILSEYKGGHRSFPVAKDVVEDFVKGHKENLKYSDRDSDSDFHYSFRGINKDGIEVYETSDEIKNLTYKERKKAFKTIMANQYKGRTAKFTRNGHTYYAMFDDEDIDKNIYGDNYSSKKGWKAKINVGADGNIFELVENALYNGSEAERGKKIASHRSAGYWDYFIKTVQIDGVVFDLIANVRKKPNDSFVYSIQLNENKKIEASPSLGAPNGDLNRMLNASDDKISQKPNFVNSNTEKNSLRNVESIETADYVKMYNHFGSTKNYDVAGYMLGNGVMLDFSGKHWGDDYSTSRQVDHRDIQEVLSNRGSNNGVNAMIDMIGNGNIRLMPEVGGINLAVKPNASQLSQLRGYINHFRGEVTIDIDEVGGDTIHSFNYTRGTSSSKILDDIKAYFDEGIVPEQKAEDETDIRQFLYSDRDSDYVEDGNKAVMTQKRIDYLIEDSGAGTRKDYAQAWIARISPTDYLNLTTSERVQDREVFDQFGSEWNPNVNMTNYDYLGQLQKSVRQTPYLAINIDTGEVVGHDGRHRIRALEMNGIKSVEIKIEFRDADGSLVKYQPKGERWESKKGMALTNQFGTKQTASAYDLIPLNEDHRSEIEAIYGENADPKASVKYSDRSPNSVSNRTLLANALESVAQNDIEKNKLAQYKEKIALIEKEEEKLAELRGKIKELSFAKGARDTKAIKDLQFEANQTANRINTYDRQLLNLESTTALKGVLEREKQKAYKRAEEKGKEALDAYREKMTKTQRELITRYKDNAKKQRERVIETRDKGEARDKLQKLILKTINWLSYPKKEDVKCPDILKEPYKEFLESIDLSSKRLQKGGDPTQKDLRLASAMDSLATAIEKIKTAQNPNVTTEQILDSGYLDLPENFVELLRTMAEDIKKKMVSGNPVVNDIHSTDVKAITKLIRTLNHAIKEMSTLYANLRFANVQELGHNDITFLDSMGEADSTNGVKDFVEWDNALPYYAFKRFGEGGESIFEGLMDAQDKLARLAEVIFGFKDKTWTDKEANEWGEDTHTITLPSGHTLTLTTADAMSIYCLSRRDNNHGMNHLLAGGVRVIGIKKGAKKASDSRSTLTQEDVIAIISSLTDRQRAVAEAIQGFMSSVCSEWGNEISMKRFLTKEFNEKFYFPIESNDENLDTKDPSAQQSDLYRLLNISATKPLTPGANNEVIIRNIFDVFTNHSSDMARLNSFGMALLDYMKWLNYREKSVNEENGQITVRGVRKSMERAYGEKAKSYVINLIKDINGRHNDNADNSFLMSMMRMSKTAAVGNNLRVAFLQFTSYPRASMVLSTGSLAKGLTRVPQIEKAKKYCGIALWKSFGFYDTNIARSIEDQIKGATNIRQKIIELSMKTPELADAITWGALWNACEYEVAKTTKNKVGSEEFYEEVGKKLREVVYATQVVDSILTRSQIMRSKSGLTQTATAYMSEPTLTANILMDAGFQFQKEKRITGSAKTAWKKTGKIVGRAVANYCVLQLLTSLAESLADAWRDDDDEEFGEKFLEAFKENLITNIIPFNKLPIISDIVELILSRFGIGFVSSDNMATTWITQIADALDVWTEVLGEAFGGEETSKTVYNAIYKTAKAISSVTGVSVSGAMREVVTLWNNTAGEYDSTLKIRMYESTNEELGKALFNAIEEGNERQVESLKAQFEDQKEMESALRSYVRKMYKDGEVSRSTASDVLTQYGGYDANETYWKLKEWDFDIEYGKDASYSKYTDFYDAVKTGRNIKAVIKEYTDNGVSKETLASQITSYYKPLYKEMSNSERASIKGYLLNAYALLGYDRNKKSKDIDKWLED